MSFVIVGGGPTGVELAGALAELKKQILPKDYPDLDIRRMQIHLVEASDRLLANMSKMASKKTEKFLKKMDVNVWLGTQVKDYDGKEVITNKHVFNSKTLVWAAGVQGAPPDGLNATIVRGNRILTDEFNAVTEKEGIYAIGDVAQIKSDAAPERSPHVGLCCRTARFAACQEPECIRPRRKPMQPFGYADKGTMATVGRNLAVVDLPFLSFSGLFAWLTWILVHLMLLVDYRSRLVVFVNWAWSYLNYDKGTRLIVRGNDDCKSAK